MNTKATTGPNDRLVDYIAVVGVGDVLDPIQEESAFNPRREVTLQLVKPLPLLLLAVACDGAVQANTHHLWGDSLRSLAHRPWSSRSAHKHCSDTQCKTTNHRPTPQALGCSASQMAFASGTHTHTHTGAPSTTPRRSRCSSPSYRNPPLPSFFTFVATGGTGLRLYGHCLTFYEPLTPTQAESFKQLEVGASASSAAAHTQ